MNRAETKAAVIAIVADAELVSDGFTGVATRYHSVVSADRGVLSSATTRREAWEAALAVVRG